MEENKDTKIAMNANESEKKVSKSLLFIKTVFHGGVLILFIVVFVIGILIYIGITEKQLEEPLIRMAKTYFICYFTIWNVSFQTTFLCLALIHDSLQWVDKHKSAFGRRIKYLRDVVFNGLVFPFSCFVHFMFWGVYWIDRELVFPKVYDEILPWWVNHCVHTNIIFIVIIETFLQSRRYPTDVKVERIMYIFINVFYAVVYYSVYFFGHCWLYGVFGVMNWWQLCFYQAGISLSSYIFYKMNFIINRLIHGHRTLREVVKNVPNGDSIRSHDLKQLGGDLRTNGSQLKSDSSFKTESEVTTNGEEKREDEMSEIEKRENVNGENGDHLNGYRNGENGRDWKSNGANGSSEVDGNGSLSKAFDKSWSTKYRSSRNQVENSSL